MSTSRRICIRLEVLIIDDWGLAVLTAPERRDLLEILEAPLGRATAIVNSQLPVEHWHEAIGDPTLAPSRQICFANCLPGNGCHPRSSGS